MLLQIFNYNIKITPFNNVMGSTFSFYKISSVLGLHLYSLFLSPILTLTAVNNSVSSINTKVTNYPEHVTSKEYCETNLTQILLYSPFESERKMLGRDLLEHILTT